MGLERGLLLDLYLGSQKLRQILTLLYCITLSSSRENQHNAQEVARRISGAVSGRFAPSQVKISLPTTSHFWHRCRSLRTSQDIPNTHHKLLSLALRYFPFASRFPLPHFTLVVLFALSFPFASLSLASCVLVCWIACHDGTR